LIRCSIKGVSRNTYKPLSNQNRGYSTIVGPHDPDSLVLDTSEDKSSGAVRCSDINNLLSNQKVSISESKRANLGIFKQIVELINSKEDMTSAGLQKIINLKASLNVGIQRSPV
jgi:hypothetical protein